MHDSFEWWAEIWIPSVLGAATVLVSVVALWTAHRATVIARQSEEGRARDADLQRQAEVERRILSEARDEARIALKWIRQSGRAGRWSDATQAAVAQTVVEADAVLTQSLVPGAADLLWLLNEGIEHIWDRPNAKKGHQIIDFWDVIDGRREILVGYIRKWATNPGAAAGELALLRDWASRDPQSFLREVLHPGTLGRPMAEPENS